ncbi:MAG: hypothetical protein IT424_07930 [Pirellulales bacterium]|nr:hypothetical protein [Pirellulales bacterium]
MLDWLVITADRAHAGRGVRGYALVWFLRTYFGRRRVGRCTPAQWRRGPAPADTLLIGLPSSLTASEINRLIARGRYRRVALFDYLDQQELPWTEEQQHVLRPVAGLYLRPWFEPDIDHGLKMGLAPIRRSKRLTMAIIADRVCRKTFGRPQPRYDVAFLGQPNETRIALDGAVHRIDQRFHWLRELKAQAPELTFWGGFVGGDPEIVARLRRSYGDLSPLYYRGGKTRFGRYYQAMRRARVLLAPGGNVPWTYRHYEALYAGGVVVTIDYRRREMLVPLPPQGVVHVPDGAPVLPAIRQALELSRARPSLGEENYAFLERYLRLGAYSRSRPPLVQRFLQQFD